MENDDIRWLGEQPFRCRAPDGTEFSVPVRLGAPEVVDDGASPLHARCRIGLAPLAEDRWGYGETGFQALLLAIDYVRTVFKLFVAEGGRVYWADSDSPVDLESPWFAPMPSPSDVGLKLGR